MNFAPLRREMGLGAAIVTGLGSILGTGAYVAIGVASGAWGDAVVIAVPLAAVVATFNGLSSAYLAGRFPVAGGSYEYGYQTLGPYWGFTAGWLFLMAKTASAATAALGVALYLGVSDRRVLAIGSIVVVTALVLAGLKGTTAANTLLVIVTVTGLLVFSFAGIIGSQGTTPGYDGDTPLPILGSPITAPIPVAAVISAVAFLFVAYTGYGRIATLGEEVHRPARTIPRAVIATLVMAAILYSLVELGGRATGGSSWGTALAEGTDLADLVSAPWSVIVAIGAVTAMLGVLLNLVLGLSRVWLAMGRRLDMPEALARLDGRSVPVVGVVTAAVPVAALALIGDLRIAWSFSAFTVLLYYGITNLAVLKLDRRRWTAWLGAASCLFLSFYVPLGVWLVGSALVAVGLIWKSQRRI